MQWFGKLRPGSKQKNIHVHVVALLGVDGHVHWYWWHGQI